MDKNHSDFHSSNAFCGNAGPEEMQHLHDLLGNLSDKKLKYLTQAVGIHFDVNENMLDRESYEMVIDETDRENFYREYRNIIASRSKKT